MCYQYDINLIWSATFDERRVCDVCLVALRDTDLLWSRVVTSGAS